MTDGPMACEDFVELVTAYLEDAMVPSARARFDEHLSECDGCTDYLQQFRVTIETMGRGGEGDLTPELRDRLLTAFRTLR
ncbi:anti-sigma factor [Mycobacterium antarcticum]|uniref:anti-sigma factor family protein n=1 Tax=unclassified Mycolicibacterium TaxID=2636767 RepID=UPI0023983515|nr:MULTISPECIES: zf-HC2 domain-containing protein [unclassified Mycolicibacterium]BDX35091.1 anti-sigma factor [Mycolicibacterium sp. TUM20985]GLP78316.1 anti-sigma factor [Mycolicibacterium sp. TUM20983]GLP81370.1 anti-sigma factor [Mycolicibacterium sp. TUM20984]